MSAFEGTTNPVLDQLLSHHAFVERLARQLAGCDAEADDVVQETWLQALRNPPKSDHSPRGWLRTVMLNVVRGRHRKSGAAHIREKVVECEVTPVSLAMKAETMRDVIQEVLALPEAFRDPILMRYFGNLDTQSIADKLGIEVATVRSRTRRGLDRIRSRMAPSSRSTPVLFFGWILRRPPVQKIALMALPATAPLILGILWLRTDPEKPELLPSIESTSHQGTERSFEVAKVSSIAQQPLPREETVSSTAESEAAPRPPTGFRLRVLDHQGRLVRPQSLGFRASQNAPSLPRGERRTESRSQGLRRDGHCHLIDRDVEDGWFEIPSCEVGVYSVFATFAHDLKVSLDPMSLPPERDEITLRLSSQHASLTWEKIDPEVKELLIVQRDPQDVMRWIRAHVQNIDSGQSRLSYLPSQVRLDIYALSSQSAWLAAEDMVLKDGEVRSIQFEESAEPSLPQSLVEVQVVDGLNGLPLANSWARVEGELIPANSRGGVVLPLVQAPLLPWLQDLGIERSTLLTAEFRCDGYLPYRFSRIEESFPEVISLVPEDEVRIRQSSGISRFRLEIPPGLVGEKNGWKLSLQTIGTVDPEIFRQSLVDFQVSSLGWEGTLPSSRLLTTWPPSIDWPEQVLFSAFDPSSGLFAKAQVDFSPGTETSVELVPCPSPSAEFQLVNEWSGQVVDPESVRFSVDSLAHHLPLELRKDGSSYRVDHAPPGNYAINLSTFGRSRIHAYTASRSRIDILAGSDAEFEIRVRRMTMIPLEVTLDNGRLVHPPSPTYYHDYEPDLPRWYPSKRYGRVPSRDASQTVLDRSGDPVLLIAKEHKAIEASFSPSSCHVFDQSFEYALDFSVDENYIENGIGDHPTYFYVAVPEGESVQLDLMDPQSGAQGSVRLDADMKSAVISLVVPDSG